jgi:2'-5' RNA ligase
MKVLQSWAEEQLRAFIGIDFNREIKAEMFRIQQLYRANANEGRWKYSGNFHLTLKFLDEITDEQKIAIDEKLSGICKRIQPFCLFPEKVGMFEGRDNVRVLWVGLGGDTDKLNALQKEVGGKLAEIGFPPDKKKFTPHITIGQDIRFWKDFDKTLKAGYEIKHVGETIDRLYLFKSEQIDGKRVYTKISEYIFTL